MKQTHIDEFIDGISTKDEEIAYARWFFALYRFPAMLKSQFSKWIRQYKLFCTYDKARWRVTGCSRLGDVWLASDFNRDCGYDLRVAVDDCSNWGEEP